MKPIFLLSLSCFIFSWMKVIPTQAKEFGCFPSPKQSFIKVIEAHPWVEFQVYNPRGYQEMGQFLGPISPVGINLIQWQLKALEGLGQVFSFKWSMAQCQSQFSLFKLDCQSYAKESPTNFRAQSIKTILVQEQSTESQVKKIRYQIPIETQGDLYFLNLEFFAPSCQFRLD